MPQSCQRTVRIHYTPYNYRAVSGFGIGAASWLHGPTFSYIFKFVVILDIIVMTSDKFFMKMLGSLSSLVNLASP